jgi:hypothetical protein
MIPTSSDVRRHRKATIDAVTLVIARKIGVHFTLLVGKVLASGNGRRCL